MKTFNGIGLSKDQTEKIFAKLAENVVTEEQLASDAEKTYREELKKLGSDKDTILSTLRNFSDTMVSNKVWNADQKKTFESMIYTADAANALYSAIQNLNLLRTGTFSSTSPSAQPTPEYSDRDKVDMYRRAFLMMKSNRSEGEAEMKRLDKLFGIQ